MIRRIQMAVLTESPKLGLFPGPPDLYGSESLNFRSRTLSAKIGIKNPRQEHSLLLVREGNQPN